MKKASTTKPKTVSQHGRAPNIATSQPTSGSSSSAAHVPPASARQSRAPQIAASQPTASGSSTNIPATPRVDNLIATPSPSDSSSLQYMKQKITHQEMLAQLKYKMRKTIEAIRASRAETRAEVVLYEKMGRENKRLDKRHADSVEKCKYIEQQVEVQVKRLTDRLSADINHEAEARNRQAALEHQSDEIGELDKKLIEIKEKTAEMRGQFETLDKQNKETPISQKPVNIASETYIEAETRYKMVELDCENIQQNIVQVCDVQEKLINGILRQSSISDLQNKSEIEELKIAVQEQKAQLQVMLQQNAGLATTLADMTTQVSSAQQRTAQLSDDLAESRQHGTNLVQQFDEVYKERDQLRQSGQMEIDNITEQLAQMNGTLLPENLWDTIQHVQALLVRLSELDCDSVCESGYTIAETESFDDSSRASAVDGTP